MTHSATTDRHFLHFQHVDSVEETHHGLLAHLYGELLRIDVVREDVVRIQMSRGGVFDEAPSHAVAVDPLAQPVEFALDRGDDVVRLRTAAVTVTLGLAPFAIDVHRVDGSAVLETLRSGDESLAYATLNDEFVLRRRAQPGDPVWGLGEKAGRGNRRGRDFTLWNTDVLDPKASGEFTAGRPSGDPRADETSTEFDPYYVSIPFLYHQDAATGAMSGSFIDNPYRAHYDLTAPDEIAIRFDGGQWIEYIFAGPDMPGILQAYTWLTGRMAVPPLWALGYHQCRWFDYTQDALEGLGREYRERDIPCDALWLDIDHMDGYRVFTWNTDRFPDVPGMLARLRAEGLRMVTIVDPGVKHDPGYWVHDQAVEREVLCRTEGGDTYIGQVWPGRTAFPDFTLPEARAWWGELNAGHVASGLAGIWNDMNEPATGEIAPDRMRFGHGQYSHGRFHNQYALLMAMGTVEGLRAARPEARTFVLSRAGFAGIQRYAANWMGDNMSRWDHLWLSIPMGNGLGISGQAFVGADVGGFAEDCNPELLARWMQHGALTPFFRNHAMAGTVDQYAWSFGPAIEGIAREAIRLRYRLLPYLYACFLRAAETGAPVQRPLVFDHQWDPQARDIDDQYLLGPHLMVAPVVEPGVRSREVYLPAGGWYDWHTGEYLDGGRWVPADAPLERLPLFARAGALIPMLPEAPASTAGLAPREIELHLFVPREDGEWTTFLQEDDGETLAFAGGARVRTTLTVRRAGSRITVRGDVDGDGHAAFAREAFVLVPHGSDSAPVRIVNSGEPFEVTLA